MVECMFCIHKVIGSNPIISTTLKFQNFGAFARLVELVDTSDLKSDSNWSIGSSPVTSNITYKTCLPK